MRLKIKLTVTLNKPRTWLTNLGSCQYTTQPKMYCRSVTYCIFKAEVDNVWKSSQLQHEPAIYLFIYLFCSTCVLFCLLLFSLLKSIYTSLARSKEDWRQSLGDGGIHPGIVGSSSQGQRPCSVATHYCKGATVIILLFPVVNS